MNVTQTIFVSCTICTAMAVAPAGPGQGDDDIEAITRPSKDPTVSFVRAGLIAEVLVKKGEAVQAGQVLVRQDDAAEQVQLEQLKAQAEDTIRIKAAQADLDQKKVDLEKFEDAKSKGVATDLEVEHARLDVIIAGLSLKLAEFQHEQDRRKYIETQIQVERMKLISPIAGRVEQILVQPGESVEALKGAIQVVMTDPLWIDVPVPLAKTEGLENGQISEVAFIGSNGPAVQGKIVHIAAVADAASDTLTVRVELANPSNRPAGEHVKVRFLPAVEADGMPEDERNRLMFLRHTKTRSN